MKVLISKSIIELYQDNHKSIDYALECLINGLDPSCYEKAIKDVKGIMVNSDKEEIEISDTTIELIKDLLNEKDVKMETIELFIWVAVLFPEI